MNEKKSLFITRVALGISLLTNLVVWQTNRIQLEKFDPDITCFSDDSLESYAFFTTEQSNTGLYSPTESELSFTWAGATQWSLTEVSDGVFRFDLESIAGLERMSLECRPAGHLQEIQDSAIHLIHSISCPEDAAKTVTVDCDEGGTWVLTDSSPDVVINLNVDEKPILKDFKVSEQFVR